MTPDDALARALDAYENETSGYTEDDLGIMRHAFKHAWRTALGQQAAVPRWRHKKRDTVYEEIGRAQLQMSTEVVEGSELVIYRGSDGKLWAREAGEFEDGRFERVREG